MPVLHAIVLGITQGLSEFLPISSSGHLLLVPWLLGWTELADRPDVEKALSVALHMGTFVGALAYFRREVATLAAAGLRSIARRSVSSAEERLAWLLLLSAVPAALVGALFEDSITEHLGAIWLVGLALVAFGLVLGAADRRPARWDASRFDGRAAILMGLAQACALQPGVSRSGVTMSMARALAFEREAAARLSFLMSLPIIGGAGVFEGAKLVAGDGLPAGFTAAFALGTLSSALTGFVAVWALLRLVRTRSFAPFVAYRVVAGITAIALTATSWR